MIDLEHVFCRIIKTANVFNALLPTRRFCLFCFIFLSLFCSKMVLSGVLNPKAKGEIVRVRCIKTEQSGHVFYDVR